MPVLLLWLTGDLTSKKRFSQHIPNHHLSRFQAVSTLSKEAGRMSPTASVCFLHTLENSKYVLVKIYKRLLQGEPFRDHSLQLLVNSIQYPTHGSQRALWAFEVLKRTFRLDDKVKGTQEQGALTQPPCVLFGPEECAAG